MESLMERLTEMVQKFADNPTGLIMLSLAALLFTRQVRPPPPAAPRTHTSTETARTADPAAVAACQRRAGV
jgi:hypothetical protein